MRTAFFCLALGLVTLACDSDTIPVSVTENPAQPHDHQKHQPSSRPASRPKVEELLPPAVPPPWTAEEIRKSMKVGRRWLLEEHQVYYVGPKKKEIRQRIAAEVVEVGEKNFKIKEVVFDAKGRAFTDPKVKSGGYDFSSSIYNGFHIKDTKITEETIKLAGRTWKARVYRNRRIVDKQDQAIEIWNSIEVPGLALKMVFKSPRRTSTLQLVKFSEGQ